jgi:F420-dependent oxidoreductase-like protein
MRFALFTSLTGTTWDDVVRLWRHGEATGWDAACVTDHFMPNTSDRRGDVLECWTALAALAAQVPRIRVGTIVSGNTYRHPAVLAKMAATVDVISGGRLLCGIGAGWQENEHAAYGIPFFTLGERLRRLDEACRVLKLLWTEDRATFAGRYYALSDAPCMPKPLQRPHPELMVGGGGERVTLRIAALHADHWNAWGGPETLARKGCILETHCAAVGRDPRTIVRSANVVLALGEDAREREAIVHGVMERLGRTEAAARDLVVAGPVAAAQDKLARLRAVGVDTVFVFVSPAFLPGDPRPVLDRFIGTVAPPLR